MDKSEKEKQILDLLMSRKDIRKLVEKSNECYSRMDFVGAMRYRQEIKDIVDRESKIMLTKSESLVDLMNNADNEYKFNMLVWLPFHDVVWRMYLTGYWRISRMG